MSSSFAISLMVGLASAAIVPPPWADPKINPCALLPRGWQMLFWPPDGRCYKIFNMGHPCPPTMELTPGRIGSGEPAECNCPPGTIRNEDSQECHQMFTRGPCLAGEYFAPNSSKPALASRLGRCTTPEECSDPTQIFWPPDGKCYRRSSRGPCSPGLLISSAEDGIAACSCDGSGGHAWEVDGRCYELYSRGPCQMGMLFLPGGRCGCTADLPHYDPDSKACYEIGSIGPCSTGHRFSLSSEFTKRAKCKCKANYELAADGFCYRLYTRGPCGAGEMFTPSCTPVPCTRSRLFYPSDGRCYKIGSQGPCRADQVVVFDFEARPSVDGIAYNAVCGCANTLSIDTPDGCPETRMVDGDCGTTPGMVVVDSACHMLYTRGPCRDGQWLIPAHDAAKAACVCKPGFTAHRETKEGGLPKDVCLPPTVSLARYLNEKYNKGR